MHAPPYFQLTVSRFGAWRLSSACLVIASTLAMGLWMAGTVVFNWPIAMTLVWFVACVCVIVVKASRQQAVRIRWDMQAWHLVVDGAAGEPVRGSLDLTVDGGAWLLLRFVPDGGSAFRDAVWLPAQRRGHENSWHALRATLYGARPAAESLSATLP